VTNAPAERQDDLELALAALVAFRAGGCAKLHSIVEGQSP